jgi:AraC family transcriptional activator of pobA
MRKDILLLDICELSENKDDEVQVNSLALYLKNHPDLYFPHRHSFYHLVLFTKGKGSHTIDFNEFLIKDYQIYFMIPGQVHTWNFEGEMDGYVVNFSQSFFNSFLLKQDYLESFSFFNSSVNDNVINLPNEIRETINTLFQNLLSSVQNKSVYGTDLSRLLLLQIFILIEEKTNKNKISPVLNYNYTLLRNFQKLIEQHFSTLHLPKEYAELLYITPNHLNALCKDYTGLQAGEIIRNRILLEAKRLLVNRNLSISEIAYALNFSDNSYFSKFFKKQIGITPEEFRKKNL